jgi:sorting nexin-1/2
MGKLKELMASLEFEEIYFNMEQEEREIEAFLESYKVREGYEQKLKDLKSSEKEVELELVKLNAGKQGVFASLRGNIESNKAKAGKELETIKEDIKVYGFLANLIVLLLGYFEIERFRKEKVKVYFETIKKVAVFQKELNAIKAEICEHVLENHNLL